jgi:hypothetical protein
MASEWMEWDVLKPLLEGFVSELPGGLTDYMQLCIDLLLSPVMLDSVFTGYEYKGMTTVRGSLMGRPGTKGTLMLFVLAAELKARCMFRSVDPFETDRAISLYEGSPGMIFRNAGDDQAAIGPIGYLRLTQDCLEELGAVLDRRKCPISPDMLYYAEEILYYQLVKRGSIPKCNFGTDHMQRLHM